MEKTYQPELWYNVFIVLGSSSAALIGLLFIATSLHLNEIVANPGFRRRAINNTSFLLMVLVESLLVLFPQPMLILGVELIAINSFGLWIPIKFMFLFAENKQGFHHETAVWRRPITVSIIFVIGIASGIALIEQMSWGLYLTAASSILLLVRAVFNAWAISLGIGQRELKDKKKE